MSFLKKILISIFDKSITYLQNFLLILVAPLQEMFILLVNSIYVSFISITSYYYVYLNYKIIERLFYSYNNNTYIFNSNFLYYLIIMIFINYVYFIFVPVNIYMMRKLFSPFLYPFLYELNYSNFKWIFQKYIVKISISSFYIIIFFILLYFLWYINTIQFGVLSSYYDSSTYSFSFDYFISFLIFLLINYVFIFCMLIHFYILRFSLLPFLYRYVAEPYNWEIEVIIKFISKSKLVLNILSFLINTFYVIVFVILIYCLVAANIFQFEVLNAYYDCEKSIWNFDLLLSLLVLFIINYVFVFYVPINFYLLSFLPLLYKPISEINHYNLETLVFDNLFRHTILNFFNIIILSLLWFFKYVLTYCSVVNNATYLSVSSVLLCSTLIWLYKTVLHNSFYIKKLNVKRYSSLHQWIMLMFILIDIIIFCFIFTVSLKVFVLECQYALGNHDYVYNCIYILQFPFFSGEDHSFLYIIRTFTVEEKRKMFKYFVHLWNYENYHYFSQAGIDEVLSIPMDQKYITLLAKNNIEIQFCKKEIYEILDRQYFSLQDIYRTNTEEYSIFNTHFVLSVFDIELYGPCCFAMHLWYTAIMIYDHL